MKKTFFIILILGLAWKLYFPSTEVSLGPGVFAAENPSQIDLESPQIYIIEDYTISAFAEFKIKAKVLSKKNYYFGREADISPTDLALGWGNMSDEQILDKIIISQSRRFYRWRVESFPIPRREIETHSANMHLIPSSDGVKKALSTVRKGDIIEISGSLVNVSNSDGGYWKSSKSRKDTGNHSCEVVWVESLAIVTDQLN